MTKKLKPHRMAALTSAAFGGWTIIRDAVIQQFGPTCKDTEYVLLLHLFDEVLPLIFYFYCTVFRGGILGCGLMPLSVLHWSLLHSDEKIMTRPPSVSYLTFSTMLWKTEISMKTSRASSTHSLKRRWKYFILL